MLTSLIHARRISELEGWEQDDEQPRCFVVLEQFDHELHLRLWAHNQDMGCIQVAGYGG